MEIKTEYGTMDIPQRNAFEGKTHFKERIEAGKRCICKRYNREKIANCDHKEHVVKTVMDMNFCECATCGFQWKA